CPRARRIFAPIGTVLSHLSSQSGRDELLTSARMANGVLHALNCQLMPFYALLHSIALSRRQASPRSVGREVDQDESASRRELCRAVRRKRGNRPGAAL